MKPTYVAYILAHFPILKYQNTLSELKNRKFNIISTSATIY